MTHQQAAARAKLLQAWGRAAPSERLLRAILYADVKHKHVRGIARELRHLRTRVGELETAALVWEKA